MSQSETRAISSSLTATISSELLQSKGDSPSQHGLETKSVFDEDLQKKIEENERLHIQVSGCLVCPSPPHTACCTAEAVCVMAALRCLHTSFMKQMNSIGDRRLS